jgi:hypothetical protein
MNFPSNLEKLSKPNKTFLGFALIGVINQIKLEGYYHFFFKFGSKKATKKYAKQKFFHRPKNL